MHLLIGQITGCLISYLSDLLRWTETATLLIWHISAALVRGLKAEATAVHGVSLCVSLCVCVCVCVCVSHMIASKFRVKVVA